MSQNTIFNKASILLKKMTIFLFILSLFTVNGKANDNWMKLRQEMEKIKSKSKDKPSAKKIIDLVEILFKDKEEKKRIKKLLNSRYKKQALIGFIQLYKKVVKKTKNKMAGKNAGTKNRLPSSNLKKDNIEEKKTILR